MDDSESDAARTWLPAEDHITTAGAFTHTAVALIVWITFLRPFEWFSFMYGFPVGYVLGPISLLVIASAIFGSRQTKMTPELKYLLFLTVQFVITVPFASWRGGAFDKVRHDVIISTVMFTAVAIGADTVRRVRNLLGIVAISHAVLSSLALATQSRDSEGRLMGVGGSYGNANDFAGILAITIPLCLVFAFTDHRILRKLFWTVVSFAMIYTVDGTLSRGGMITVFVAITACLWNFAHQQKKRGAWILLGLLMAATIVMSSSAKFRERFSVTFVDAQNTSGAFQSSAASSAEERRRLFWRGVDVMIHHPLLGVGPGNFLSYNGGTYGDWHVSHNTYTQLGAEIGIPGLLFFLLSLWFAFRHLRIIATSGSSTEARLLAGALKGSLLGYAVSAAFADTAYLFYPYFFIIICGALWQADRNRAASPAAGPEAEPIDSNDVEFGLGPRIQDGPAGSLTCAG